MQPHTVHLLRLHDLLNLKTVAPHLESLPLLVLCKGRTFLNQLKTDFIRQLHLLLAYVFLRCLIFKWKERMEFIFRLGFDPLP